MNLEARVCLLTGARRIGALVAEALAVRGADIVLTYQRSEAEAKAVAETVQQLGRRALVLQADVSEPRAAPSVITEIDRAFGRLDVLVNMASVYRSVPIERLDHDEWTRQLAVDLGGAFLFSQAAAPMMRRAGGGRIINFTDWVAASGRPRYFGFLAYYVAKAGVKALTEAMALELAADGILVNAIAPGPIVAPPGTPDDEIEEVARATPVGRWGGEAEIVKAVLAYIDSDFITGETLRVDGGRHLR
jgi:NAD(P)-dependent dehydrogenase (short-subunit alcohol dehydrogenase family)